MNLQQPLDFYCVKKNIVMCYLLNVINPLNSISKPFCNPGTTMITLVGTVTTDSDEEIFSNDVRWCP